MEKMTPQRVALVVVHGVASHPRYEFQDQCAERLRDELNAAMPETSWVVDAINPGNVLRPGDDNPQPTISRVHRADDADPAAPDGTYYDVTEAYWSPISKGRTNWLWVVNWILRIVFIPLNTTARYHATWKKQFFDYGYIGGALLLAFALFFAAISDAWVSLLRVLDVSGLLAAATAGRALTALDANVSAPGGAPVKVVVWLIVGVIGAILIGQALSAIWKLIAQRRALARNPGAIVHRLIAIAFLTVVGSAFMFGTATAHFSHGNLGWRAVAFVVLIFVSFQLGYALLIGFMVGFFGDVQVYTTRDENDSKFHALRDKILDVTVDAIARAISPQLNGGRRYDRVIVLAHSLGATIAMDAFAQLFQLSLQGAIRPEEFARIRAFVTAGASIEKTRYFFDVSGAAPTASFDRWRREALGLIFTPDPAVLKKPPGSGVFWANYWYFQDPICNEILSYRSHMQPGDPFEAERRLVDERDEHPICANQQGSKRMTLWHPMLHSDYVEDPWFWRSGEGHLGVLEIVTGSKPT